MSGLLSAGRLPRDTRPVALRPCLAAGLPFSRTIASILATSSSWQSCRLPVATRLTEFEACNGPILMLNVVEPKGGLRTKTRQAGHEGRTVLYDIRCPR